MLDGHHQAGLREMQRVSVLAFFCQHHPSEGNVLYRHWIHDWDINSVNSGAQPPMSLPSLYKPKFFRAYGAAKFRLGYARGKFTTLIYIGNS